MQTAQQLFERWQELNVITDEHEPGTPAFDKAYTEQCQIENTLHDSHKQILSWDRAAQQYKLVLSED